MSLSKKIPAILALTIFLGLPLQSFACDDAKCFKQCALFLGGSCHNGKCECNF